MVPRGLSRARLNRSGYSVSEGTGDKGYAGREGCFGLDNVPAACHGQRAAAELRLRADFRMNPHEASPFLLDSRAVDRDSLRWADVRNGEGRRNVSFI
jgi:hypothetical protein